jgi:hypothetical protein
LPVPPPSGLELGVIAEVDERVLGGKRDDVDRTACAAVAAIGSAARHELLAAKTQAAIATGSGCDVDVDFVDKHRNQVSGIGNQAWARYEA